VCGGAAFRKELGIERRFRDARAARVIAARGAVDVAGFYDQQGTVTAHGYRP
jgi:alkylation response protein AidB-like acyl-CoA dehydrogenase